MLLSLILMLSLTSGILLELKRTRAPVQFLGVSNVYGGYTYVSIIRIDDFVVDPSYIKVLPDNLLDPREYFKNYQDVVVSWILKNHRKVPVVIGLITGCKNGNCSSYWSLYEYLVKVGWEIASHTRWHVRPPRDPSDYLGSIRDIESNVTGYKVVTYILPFGKASKGEISLLTRHSCVRIVMTTRPLQFKMPSPSAKMIKLGFTVKLSEKLPWRPMLLISEGLARALKGLVIVYTHATSYDWKDPTYLLHALNITIASLENTGSWITTPRVLWIYELESERINLYPLNSTSFKITYRKDPNPCGLKLVPITLNFRLKKGYRVEGVRLNGKLLKLYERMPYIPVQGYVVRGREVFVTLIPKNGEIITFDIRR